MEIQIKLLTGLALSFALVLGLFIGVILGLYFFSLTIAENANNFINEMPLEKILSIGGISSVLFFISRKYKK